MESPFSYKKKTKNIEIWVFLDLTCVIYKNIAPILAFSQRGVFSKHKKYFKFPAINGRCSVDKAEYCFANCT